MQQQQQQRRSVLNNISNRPSLGPPSRRQTLKPPNTAQRQAHYAPRQQAGDASSRRASVMPARPSLGPRPLSLGGTEAQGQPTRRSSVFSGSQRKQQDPRDLKDKAFIRNCKRRLITFVVQNGYNHPISEQAIAAPNSKDFFYLFEFLYRMLNPKFMLNDSPAEQVPFLFAEMNYPCRITKSSLISPGSPHIWPQLLAALVWMVELVEYDATVRKIQQEMLEGGSWGSGDPAFDGRGREEKLFYVYLSNAYASWLEGEDDCSALTKDLEQAFDTRNKETVKETETFLIANEALKKEIVALQNAPSRTAPLTQKKNDLMKDSEKFRDYNAKLVAQKEALAERIAALKSAISEEEKELTELTKDNEGLRATVAAQEISPADVERMMKSRQSLQESLVNVAAQRKQIDSIVWEREIAVSKSLENVENAVQEYNLMLTKLRLVGPSAKFNLGFDFLKFKPHASTASEMLSVDLKTNAKPKLQVLKGKLEEKMRHVQDKHMKEREQEDALEEAINEGKDCILLLETQLQKLEHNYRMLKANTSAALKEKVAELNRLQEDIAKTQGEAKNLLMQKQKAVEKATQELTEVEKMCAREKETLGKYICETLEVLMQHKGQITQMLAALQKDLKDQLADVLKTSS